MPYIGLIQERRLDLPAHALAEAVVGHLGSSAAPHGVSESGPHFWLTRDCSGPYAPLARWSALQELLEPEAQAGSMTVQKRNPLMVPPQPKPRKTVERMPPST